MDKNSLRDLYLRDIQQGKIQGPLMENIFSNKPWTKYLSKDHKREIINSDTLYNNFKKIVLENPNALAVYVSEKKKWYTRIELLKIIDKTSATLKKHFQINENSTVALCLNSSIEDPVMLLALNKLGCKSKWIDYFKSPQEIEHSINSKKVDLLVVDEVLLNLITNLNQNNIPILKANTNGISKKDEIVSFEELMEIQTNEKIEPFPYVERRKTVIINSSGTTGPSKPIGHSDYSINSAAEKLLWTDYALGEDNVIMKMVPSQIGLGLVTSMYSGLVSGTPVALVNGKSIEEMAFNMISFVKNFPNFIKENHLNPNAKLTILTAPIHVRILINSEEIEDLSFVNLMAAGSKISEEELNNLETKARQKGYNLPICNAYGQNEFAGGISYNHLAHNKNGSAGIPAIGTDIQIIDSKAYLESNTYIPLKENQIGIILERSASEFIEYEGMEEKTKSARLTLKDGTTWFNTNDLGYMDEDGFLFITGRLTRCATRNDAKIDLDGIESKIRSIPDVLDCAIVLTSFGGSMEEFTAFIQMKDNTIDIKTLLTNNNILNQFEFPNDFVYVNQIRYKDTGKIDYIYYENIIKNNDMSLKKAKIIK